MHHLLAGADFDLFTNDDSQIVWLLIAVFGTLTSAVYFWTLRRIILLRKRTNVEVPASVEAKWLTRFRDALVKGVRDGLVESVDDAVQLLSGSRPPGLQGMSVAYDLEWALQAIWGLLLADRGNEEWNLTEQQRSEVAGRVRQLLAEFQAEAPFASVPKPERDFLVDALHFADSGDAGMVRERLEQIGAAIHTRYEDLADLKSTSRLSLNLALLGLVATIGFGILAFALR